MLTFLCLWGSWSWGVEKGEVDVGGKSTGLRAAPEAVAGRGRRGDLFSMWAPIGPGTWWVGSWLRWRVGGGAATSAGRHRAPCFASMSACSLPSTLACPGTQPIVRIVVCRRAAMSSRMLAISGLWALACHLPILTLRAYWLSTNR